MGVGSALTPDERAAVRLVIELVDLLAERHGFDPTELVNPRTGTPLGPVLARMRDAMRNSEQTPPTLAGSWPHALRDANGAPTGPNGTSARQGDARAR
jgi:hypothetical protein